ncbi:hypothetical protein, variant [Saprolegnia diclina VS20]|uniref:PDZ domain-containing protein n=1 Tax=Saprolegnia diclina (strain VS20) TaxID=1156394 RepID=T0QAN1_SAPDV|nr:hypothetical protein SDRG_10527 [Saprolegnia diclina VS20]XP_008614744.1 hypothetical protein, variant [Saprolegnia diclina VS20]EQC31736.1 hypothetical protein SDRG_10527 [Saprolegnia diclina VS20]EQC31737.1 hypothetical protein, variant [Saprolegnia diclina VS20]|eukprot:XP_008614743.1 hypothetical protein SDRG_10527 [Saprolegnia diclina VS20]
MDDAELDPMQEDATMEEDMEIASPAPEAGRWLASLQEAIPAIVIIRLMSVRAFDGDGASFSVATGFVVDKTRGLILTNRHVVTSGPVVADAIFVNKEEVDLVPIYRDPVHDFGFYRFDPSRVKFLKLHEIPLNPGGAKVGAEIRVVGNDAGEKLSILPGILAKLDREAPNYGTSGYNDFNTFYYAAASSTSGGSSGSPVLNIDGEAIALNAGGSKKAASSFYLPLDRAVRALKLIQQDILDIPRGTWQTIFRHAAYDEVRKLGLTADVEADVRKTLPDETGLLVVDQVLPKGPAFGLLEPGDIVIRIQGQLETTFLAMEALVDSNVGNVIPVEIQRGGRSIVVHVTVQDLHAITPNQFLEVGGCILHSLSYQQARNASLPVGHVYLAQAGHMLMKAHIAQPCIVVSLDGKPTPTLEAFISAIKELPNGYRTVMRYFLTRDRHRIRNAVLSIDRQWFPMQLYTRNDADGLWHRHKYEAPPTPLALQLPAYPAAPLSVPGLNSDLDKATFTKLLSSLVMVAFDIPCMIDGISSSSYNGVGIVIDAVKGLVLVDQNTVPIALGDVVVTVAASIETPAKVLFVHPVHNFSIIQYDPALLGDTRLESAELSSEVLQVGDQVDFVGLTSTWTVVAMKSLVTKIDRLVLRDFQPPRYKASNVEVIHFDRITKSVGGIFVDSRGLVTALWLSFSYQDEGGRREVFRGMSVDIIREVVDLFHGGASPRAVTVLPIQLYTYPLSKARAGLGLSPHWIRELEQCYDDKRQVLAIKRCAAGTDAYAQLQSGDLLLSIDGTVVAKDFDVERLCMGKSEVQLVVLREQQEMTLPVQTMELSGWGTSRVITWCGLVIQEPHYAVVNLGYVPEEGGGVYCSRWCYGSPAHKYGLRATMWIVQVNNEPTPTLDAFIKVVENLQNGASVRMKTVALNTKPKVLTLKTDYHYWPTVELCRNADLGDWAYVFHPNKP